jgi:peptidoglycan/xylan/chitin deacetylase (PgdA/CDA1 family)
VIILGYHRITPWSRGDLSIQSDTFRYQMQYLLERGFHNVSLADVAQSWPNVPRNGFAVTFDDGYRDNYSCAMPILRELGITATVFLAVSYIGTSEPFFWDETRRIEWQGRMQDEDLPLTWDHVDEMVSSGIFTIGSHTLTHPNLTMLSTEAVQYELVESRRLLEQRLQRSIDLFCYPRGDLNNSVVNMVKQAGYRLAVVTPKRPLRRTQYTVFRIGIDVKHGPRAFTWRISPAFERLQVTGVWPQLVRVRHRFHAPRLWPS